MTAERVGLWLARPIELYNLRFRRRSVYRVFEKLAKADIPITATPSEMERQIFGNNKAFEYCRAKRGGGAAA